MRKYFVDSLISLMSRDEDIIFLTADLGFGSFEIIAEKFPGRYYNVGIAEQNMIGTACGLSLKGKKVIVYSIANFTTLRVIEQIRNYLVYHDSKVLIVNGGGGFSYGQLGFTHYATEDISMMLSLPKIEVFAPFDEYSIKASVNEWYTNYNVAYLRLEKNDIVVPGNIKYNDGFAVVGNADENRKIICYGSISAEVIKAIEYFNHEITVLIVYRLKDAQKLLSQIKSQDYLLTVEENAKRGGFGQFILAESQENGINLGKTKVLGITDHIPEVIGDQEYMREQHELTTEVMINFFKQ